MNFANSERRGINMFRKIKSLPNGRSESKKLAPSGCFSVYVGPEKERFMIKTKYANHPSFKMLLEDAESEYGLNIKGALQIPCEVGLFYKVLVEMSSGKEREDDEAIGRSNGTLCSPFSPVLKRLGSRKGYSSTHSILTSQRSV